MKPFFIVFLSTALFFFSCKEENTTRTAENKKDAQKKENTFKSINQSWNFVINDLNPEAQEQFKNWKEWNAFLAELKQKPKSSMGAFQKKSKTLTAKAFELNNNIPAKFATPAIKSRISVLLTQFQSLDLYINLQEIQREKVVTLIPEINTALNSLVLQLDEIVRKSHIPLEQGESDIIKMLDTTRAVKAGEPEEPSEINLPKI
jgi:hypothetical protein